MTNPTRDSAENTVIDNASAADDGDWLGYGVYADALWSRIETALAKDLIKGELGDDPLVIGVFGEWGAGKSHLLKLMYDEAQGYAKQRIGWRKTDKGFGLTVPVVFQPWKYEHEAHLHVPLMLHIFSALKKQLSDGATGWEKFVKEASDKGDKVVKFMPSVVGLFEKCFKATVAATDGVVSGGAATAIATATALAKQAAAGEAKGTNDAKSFKYSDDGRFYFEMHEALKAVTRPTKKNGYLQDTAIGTDIRINFVVFIDDLDRCLPEKAVQVLELIKTVFNVESFAFVLALDDEVIERGIGHRYKEYKLQDKKPEMPITGFEYLEKIVHLPFRLPALTLGQAQEFVWHYENAIEAKDKSLQWFGPQALSDGARKTSAEPAVPDGNTGLWVSTRDATHPRLRPHLLPFVMAAFDTYVPRKLIRLVELLHQTSRIAALARPASPARPLGQRHDSGHIDLRLVLFLAMVQLFHPDLYRLFKRRPRCFRELFDAFVPNATMATTPTATTTAGASGLHDGASDIDLWHWAAYHVGHAEHKADRPSNRPQAVEWMAGVTDAQRGPAQRIRLPLVEVIVEHRAAQRHVFDALKLVAALVKDGVAFNPDFKIEHYFSLLTPAELAPAPAAVANAAPPPWAGQRMAPVNVQRLYESLLSPNRETQEQLAADNNLISGQMLRPEDLAALLAQLELWLADKTDTLAKQYLLLRGLYFLAPYVAPGEGAALWDLVKQSADTTQPTDPKLRARWGDVRAALGCDPRFVLPLWLAKENTKDDATAFDTTADAIPGFVFIDSRKKPFWFGDGATKTKKPVQLPGLDQPFYMARTLTTVAQYDCFVQSKDYRAAFQGEGLRWLDGSYSEVTDKDIERWLDRRPASARLLPYQWQEQLANRLRPVTNVSWFEAQAYARWLGTQASVLPAAFNGQTGTFNLPTELQWECAARFGRVLDKSPSQFPWGDRFAHLSNFANVQNLVDHASVVGLYPQGHSATGLADLAGNVWEWMGHRYVSNYDPLKPVEMQNAIGMYTLRGGSRINDREFARCSYRVRNPPVNWNVNIGFRVVLSLPISGGSGT